MSDPEKDDAKEFGVVNEQRPNPQRWTFYISKDGKILAIDKQVKAGSHGADIAARLGELGVEKSK